MDKSLISVIVTAYNADHYIGSCIESILSQTYQDYELIIVNDGSTDQTEQIIKKYISQNQTIKYVSQKNAGVSVARNTGIELSQGQYICFIDGDDQLEKNMLETLSQTVTKDVECDICACCCHVFGNEPEFTDSFFKDDMIFTEEKKEALFRQLLDPVYGQPDPVHAITAIGVPWGKLYRRSFLLDKSLRFDPALRRMQDNVFNMYCFAEARKIRYINKPLYRYRESHISTYFAGYDPEIYRLVLEQRELFFQKYPEYLTGNLKNDLLQEKTSYLSASIRNICTRNNYQTAKKKIMDLYALPVYKDILDLNSQDSRKIKILKYLLKKKWLFPLYFVSKLRYAVYHINHHK